MLILSEAFFILSEAFFVEKNIFHLINGYMYSDPHS